jgi:hypothetical protein
MRGGFDHAPGGAGRTHTPPFAGVGDQGVVAAFAAAGAGKTVGENAAFEIAAEFTLGHRGCGCSATVILKCQPGRQMRLHSAVEQRALGLAAVIGCAARQRASDGGEHGVQIGNRDGKPYAQTAMRAIAIAAVAGDRHVRAQAFV